jgi:hypothetical protein
MNRFSEQTLTAAIDQKEETAPRQVFLFSVFLFSGHMVDAPAREHVFRLIKNRLRLL